MQAKGRDKKTVLAELKRIRQEDERYEDGGILCSMCTSPLSVAKIAHQMFLCSNLGDPGLFPGSQRLEKEIIRTLSALLNLEGGAGFIVSGGTEANLMALLVARNLSKVDKPEVILPESAHFSLTKICNLLKMKPVNASLDSKYRVDTASVERCFSENTVAVVGTAGTAELGAVDSIGKLSEIALKHRVYLHVDAAFGGLVIPFLEKTEKEGIDFDFKLGGVSSITVDPHKMGMATIPAGGILFRNPTFLEQLRTETPYLSEEFQYTFVGTRSGASVAATWAAFASLGIEGFTGTVKRCMKLTRFLTDGLATLGFKLVTEPTLNIVAFHSADSKALAEALHRLGWFVSRVPRLDCLRIVVMPHLRQRHVRRFLDDLSRLA
jgi:tyrosine decarboxylase/aspartate 1-decarboxylase